MIQSIWITIKYIFSADFIKNLEMATYWVRGGYKKVTIMDQSILIMVDHRRALKRAKTYAIKEPDTLAWLDSFEPGSCYFDIGANIGQYSLYPAKKYGNQIEIYAFEPQSNNYDTLNKNIYYNSLTDHISAYCIAVSGRTEFAKLYIPKFRPGGNRSQFGKQSLDTMNVTSSHIQGMFGVTLDDLCGKWGFPYPNYMKIDVDGIEIPILKAAKKILAHPNLKSVIVELGTHAEQQEAMSIMKMAGLELRHKTERNWGETCYIFEKIK